MMFLQFFFWRGWYVTIGNDMTEIGMVSFRDRSAEVEPF